MIETNELVTVILVSYFSNKNLKKILKQIPNKYSVIITENSLNINLKKEIENDYKNVEILIPNTNLGNGGGVNYALEEVRTKYALYLDIDIELMNDSIDKLIKIAEKQKDWAILAPNLKNYIYNSNYFIKKDLKHNLSKMRFVEGCALFFNFKKLKRYGFYDDKIFLYYEEDDLFFKYQKYNLDTILCENIYIKHKGNSSTDEEFKLEIELNRNWHYMWSKFYYYKKNFSYLRGIKETLGHFIKSIIKLIFFYPINKNKFLIYKNRALGLINSYLNKPSWRRPKLK
jgi:N-acetylglucosaminyl-diphospho-decaprenol L-rhamnosyltransferase